MRRTAPRSRNNPRLVRPGDSIVVNRAEAELLQSDTFAQAVTRAVAEKIKLEPAPPEGYRLALPHVGRPVAEALHELGQGGGSESMIAEHLAAAIEQRLASN
jgi:hypothetical protein